MLWIDIKYANMLAIHVERFKVKSQNPYIANFRCPLCGDSNKKKSKARGFLYVKNGGLLYKCHNCNAGMGIGNFIKTINPALHNDYMYERYSNGAETKNSKKLEFSFSQPVFLEKNPLDRLFHKVSELPPENEAILYLKERKIPKSIYDKFYYCRDVQTLHKLTDRYKDRIKGTESRLIIPFYNSNKELVGVTCRAFGDEKPKYLVVSVDPEQDMIYNIHNVDKTKTVYCLEGPLDSLFVKNSIAIGSSGLMVAEKHIPKHNLVLVFDNEPRNKEIVKIMKRAQERDFSVVIWPDWLKQKDINEMIMDGMYENEVMDLIRENTYKDLLLKIKLSAWSKC